MTGPAGPVGAPPSHGAEPEEDIWLQSYGAEPEGDR